MTPIRQVTILLAACLVIFIIPNTLALASDALGQGTDGALYKAIVQDSVHIKEGVTSPGLMESFYRSYGYRRIWTEEMTPRTEVLDLIESVKLAGLHGLDPEQYNLAKLEEKLSRLVMNRWRGAPGPRNLATEVEVLATDTFLSYGSDLLLGRARPESMSEDMKENGVSGELMSLLYSTLSSSDIKSSIAGLAPSYYEYTRLQEALQKYEAVERAGGWPDVGGPIKKGISSPKVLNLRKRLEATRDLIEYEPDDPQVYDKLLHESVINFQMRHGLPPTGYVGKLTLAAMNMPVSKRIEIIKLNMERLRWLPVYAASTLVTVNLTDFSLRVIRGREPKLVMKVIIGKEFTSTPTFTTKMTAVILNPSWKVPHAIAVDEILPRIKADHEFFNLVDMKVYNNNGYRGAPLDPTMINWEKVSSRRFPYSFVRGPGEGNPLGKLKFAMPNKHSVYLHDTPKGGLFDKEVRAFSHGCVRLEKPLELALVLINDSKWDARKIKKAIDTGKEKVIRLNEPALVQLVYRTAWVEENGVTHFRDDIYGEDKKLAELMKDGSARALEVMAGTSKTP